MDEIRKYALVTGASSGIGWHISEELARRGYSILAVSNQPDKLRMLKEFLEKSFKVTVVTLNRDLAQEDSAIQLFRFCEDNGFAIEVLVNDAGMFFFSEVTKADYERVKSILTLHILTPTLLCRLFGEQMAKKRRGYILNLSSITAMMPYPGISLYAPTKAYMRHFTRAFRSEMMLDNVKVTCLMPGATDTALYNAGNVNVSLLKKTGMMKSPQAVAGAGIKALFRGRGVCIPGFFNKIILIILPVIPRFIIEMIARRSTVIRKE
jgi:short-subunit dehydrogenase